MTYTRNYADQEPTRAVVDEARGLTLLEFGAHGCGHCVAIQPALAKVLAARDEHAPPVLHHKIHDGAGRPLGRSFGIKLWPTFVLLRDGAELGRVVRPHNAREIDALLDISAANRSEDASSREASRAESQ